MLYPTNVFHKGAMLYFKTVFCWQDPLPSYEYHKNMVGRAQSRTQKKYGL